MNYDMKLEELDLYEILGLPLSSSTTEIKKAYRKKALECHPDKNPNNPNAAKDFHQLSKILEILTDEAARKAYDQVLNAKKQAEIRHKECDSKRRKLKEDLEFREKQFVGNRKARATAADKLKDEIERLRKEGSRQVEDEIAKVMMQINEEKIRNSCDASNYRIKIKWKVDKKDNSNGGYTEEILKRFLLKYGDISEFLLSSKKKGCAIVEFKTKTAAEMALQLEIGLPCNPLKLQWVSEPATSNNIPSTTIKPSDYESIVLTKLRQAEERKRLIEQIMVDDNHESTIK